MHKVMALLGDTIDGSIQDVLGNKVNMEQTFQPQQRYRATKTMLAP